MPWKTPEEYEKENPRPKRKWRTFSNTDTHTLTFESLGDMYITLPNSNENPGNYRVYYDPLTQGLNVELVDRPESPEN